MLCYGKSRRKPITSWVPARGGLTGARWPGPGLRGPGLGVGPMPEALEPGQVLVIRLAGSLAKCRPAGDAACGSPTTIVGYSGSRITELEAQKPNRRAKSIEIILRPRHAVPTRSTRSPLLPDFAWGPRAREHQSIGRRRQCRGPTFLGPRFPPIQCRASHRPHSRA